MYFCRVETMAIYFLFPLCCFCFCCCPGFVLIFTVWLRCEVTESVQTVSSNNDCVLVLSCFCRWVLCEQNHSIWVWKKCDMMQFKIKLLTFWGTLLTLSQVCVSVCVCVVCLYFLFHFFLYIVSHTVTHTHSNQMDI